MSIRSGDQQCIAFPKVFHRAQLARMRSAGDEMLAVPGVVDYGSADYRKASVAAIIDTALTSEVWDVVREINENFWKFDLDGIEALQYIVYRQGDHYGWHIDKGPLTEHPRKLSLSIQLSNPDEYEGGELQVNGGNREYTCQRALGTVLAFPSWVLHRVAPVTKGERRALVVWAHGPQFR